MKTYRSFFTLVVLLVTLTLSCTSCSKDEAPPPPTEIADTDQDGIADANDNCPNAAGPASNQGCPEEEESGLTFADVINLGADPEEFPTQRTEEEVGEPTTENEDVDREDGSGGIVKERFICTRRTVSVLDGNGEFPLFDTNADVIYPGNLLQGKTLQNATPAPIVVKRAGGTISYNLNNGNLNSSFTVEEVKKSTIQDGMNNIIASAGEAVPANFDLEIVQIESESQLAIELGIDVETLATKTSGNMAFSQDKSYNRTLVKLTQSYYTMSFDLPTSLDEIFDESVTPEDLAVYVQADNPATFISSVTYGRIFYMLIESTSSRTEMQAQLNLAYDGVAAQVEGSLNTESMQQLNDLKIKVIAYGGDASGIFALAGETDVNEIADKIAQSTSVQDGLPLSYVARSVKRPDQIVGVKLATEYDIVNCELKGVLPPQVYLELVDLFKDDADGGGIGAMTHISDSNILVFNKMGDKYAWFNGTSGTVLGVYGIKDNDSPLGVVPLDNVGAGLFRPFASFLDNQIQLINKTGNRLAKFSYPALDLGGTDTNLDPPIRFGTFETGGDTENDKVFFVNEEYGYGAITGYMFGNSFIGAALHLRGVDDLFYTLISGPGTEFQNRRVREGFFGETTNDDFTAPKDIRNWIYNSNNALPFEKVGAACYIQIGGQDIYLFVNEAGNELAEGTLTVFSGQNLPTAQFDAPWVIN